MEVSERDQSLMGGREKKPKSCSPLFWTGTVFSSEVGKRPIYSAGYEWVTIKAWEVLKAKRYRAAVRGGLTRCRTKDTVR